MNGSRFEKILWSLRYVVLLSVILSIFSSISLMFLGSWDIIEAIFLYNPLIDPTIENNNQLLFKIISSIDLFLIAIVLLIFGFDDKACLEMDRCKTTFCKEIFYLRF